MEEKLRLFAEYGFECLHWCDDWNNDIFYSHEDMDLYLSLIESSGLRCLDIHGTATPSIQIDSESEGLQSAYVRLLENRVEFCSVVGGDALVIHPPMLRGTGDSGLRIKRSLSAIDAVRPLCEDLSVAIAVENSYWGDEEILQYYFDRYPPEFVGFCFDSGHANIHGNFQALSRFGDRLKALHLHDNKGEKDDHQPPLWGTVDWVEVLRWIRGRGYDKPVNFEVAHDPDLYSGSMQGFLKVTVDSILEVLALPLE
ncbi:MAG: sugar phosphate isomerase/epimerase family protein [Candidatus Bathyarchaeia archaeon]